jgi:DNA-binding NarL/FixJ family response regulator
MQIVLLDLSLPDSKGAATFKTAHRQFPAIPILVLTGNEDETMAFAALAEGVNNYIMKDRVSPGFLWEAIKNTLEKKRMIEQL